MSAPHLVTVEAYGIRDLPEAMRDLVVERERVFAWDTWLRDEVGERLTLLVADRLGDTVDGLNVTAWSMLDGGAPSMVVEGHVVDAAGFAAAVGVPDHDVALGLTLDPYHARGGTWAGTTYVIRHHDDAVERDDVMSEALGELIGEVLHTVEVWADEVTSDAAIVDQLDADGWSYDRLGRDLDLVIVDAPEEVVA